MVVGEHEPRSVDDEAAAETARFVTRSAFEWRTIEGRAAKEAEERRTRIGLTERRGALPHTLLHLDAHHRRQNFVGDAGDVG